MLDKIRYHSGFGLVLRTYPHREGDLNVDLLLERVGLVHAIAKNALKSHRRFGGCLTFPSLVRLSLARRAGQWYLEETLLEEGFLDLKTELRSYSLTGYVVECVRTCAVGPDTAEHAFPFLLETLKMLRNPPTDWLTKKAVFDLKLLELLGLGPQTDLCVHCEADRGHALAGKNALAGYDVPAGSVICQDHLAPPGTPEARGQIRVSTGTLKTLAVLARGPLSYPKTVVLGRRQKNEALRLTGRLIEQHLGFRPRALDVMRQAFRRQGTSAAGILPQAKTPS